MQAIQFLKEVREELNKVVWPTREQTIKMTAMVVIVTVVLGIFIGGLDLLLTRLTAILIK